jgi:hypothetical protein
VQGPIFHWKQKQQLHCTQHISLRNFLRPWFTSKIVSITVFELFCFTLPTALHLKLSSRVAYLHLLCAMKGPFN